MATLPVAHDYIVTLFLIKGLPIGAVKNSMQRDQQDPTIMDLDPEKSLESQRPPKLIVEDGPALNKDPELPLKEDPTYSKYFKMLKMVSLFVTSCNRDCTKMVIASCNVFVRLVQGLPMGAVKNALQRDGLDPSIMDLDPERSVVSQLQAIEEEKEVDKDPPLKDDPTYRCANTFPSMCVLLSITGSNVFLSDITVNTSKC